VEKKKVFSFFNNLFIFMFKAISMTFAVLIKKIMKFYCTPNVIGKFAEINK